MPWLGIGQALFVMLTMAGLLAAPPASGRILLVPIDGTSRDDLARIAVGTGARLVDAGPFGGSLVVSGNSAALIGALMPRHALVLRAPSGGCGEKGQVS